MSLYLLNSVTSVFSFLFSPSNLFRAILRLSGSSGASCRHGNVTSYRPLLYLTDWSKFCWASMSSARSSPLLEKPSDSISQNAHNWFEACVVFSMPIFMHEASLMLDMYTGPCTVQPNKVSMATRDSDSLSTLPDTIFQH